MHRTLPALAAAGLVAVLIPFPGPVSEAATAIGTSSCTPAVASPPAGAVTKCKTVTRINLDASGNPVTSTDPAYPSTRHVHVTVSETSGLVGRQDIAVNWTGAQPTVGSGDVNSSASASWSYPMVLLECRGVDNASAPTAKQISPKTCWTHTDAERINNGGPILFQPWNLDRYATGRERLPGAGAPAHIPSSCLTSPNVHWVPFVAANGKAYNYGPGGCAGLPPEDYEFDSVQQLVPPNSTFGITQSDGTGSAKFDVWTDEQNTSLGCSASVPCSLVVIPIMGISCDPYGVSPDSPGLTSAQILSGTLATTYGNLCESTAPGQTTNQGNLWWSPSNWRNRISFRLGLAPTSKACAGAGGAAPVTIYGTQLMNEAMQQWMPHFCGSSKLFPLDQIQTSEPLAQSLMNDPTSGVHAAFATDAPLNGFSTPTVKAPIAVTGFAISFTADNAQHREVTSLRLDARLLAKLLTESYLGQNFKAAIGAATPYGPYSYLAGNPLDILVDPEFQALNPGITRLDTGLGGDPTNAMMLTIAENSDVVSALTSYINADPEARAWLDGKPDPWGMVVNKNYKGIALPLQRWPLLDQTLVAYPTDDLVNGPCATQDPTPWLSLVASPVPDLTVSAADVQFASSPSKISCSVTGDIGTGHALYQWTAVGRQEVGDRFVLGITSLSAAKVYGLNTAELESQSNVSDPTAKFTDATGRTFVGPSTQSLTKAATLLSFDRATQTWQVPYAKMRSDAAGQNAYPGIMPVYAAVPTSGLPRALANHYSEFLNFADGPGQTPGVGIGQLPRGYLPMTQANGLGALASYTARAAAAVKAQRGTSSNPLNTKGPSSTPTPSVSGRSSTSPPTEPTTPVNPTATSTTGAPTSAGASPTGDATPTSSGSLAAQTVTTPSTGLGAIGVFIPLLLGAALLGGLAAAGVVVRPSSLWTMRGGRRRR